MSIWDVLKALAETDKGSGASPLTGTSDAGSMTQEQRNWYDSNFNK